MTTDQNFDLRYEIYALKLVGTEKMRRKYKVFRVVDFWVEKIEEYFRKKFVKNFWNDLSKIRSLKMKMRVWTFIENYLELRT